MEALNENVAVDAKDVVGAKVVCAYCMKARAVSSSRGNCVSLARAPTIVRRPRALEGGKHACILRAK